jgi:4-amino-4-deoxy-L-arabinose transferase-like glycosyltransferase
MIRRWHVAGLVALAAATRVIAAIHLGDRFHFIDEAIYVDAARMLLTSGGYGAGYTNVPAHPVFLALLAAPSPGSIVLLRCWHAIVTGVLGGLVIHALGTRTFGAGAAVVALALWALDPLVVVAGGLLYPDAIAAVALATALLALVTATQEDRLPASAVAGILLGLTVLFRPVAAMVVPICALWIAFVPRAPAARRARHALVVVVGCGVAVAPWVAANLAREGHVVPTSMAGLQAAPVKRSERHRDGIATSLGRAVWQDPVRILRRVQSELVHFWELYPTRLQTDDPSQRASLHGADQRLPEEQTFSPGLRDAVSAVTFGTELAFALAGIVVGWRSHRALVGLLVAVAFFYGLGYALFVAKLRYRIVVLPGVFLLAGVAASALLETVRARQEARAVGADARRPAA